MPLLPRLKRFFGLGARDRPVNVPADAPAAPVEGENVLLISDLHLGEACKEHTRIEYLKRAATLDEHFCGFLDHFTRNRVGGRPWCLILGGDLLDFLQVTIVPRDASEEARLYGLGSREEESAWKLERLMERHRRVFVYLADFVGVGNRVEVIQGNHDEELFWPAVRERLVSGLVDLYFGAEAQHEDDPEAFAARVHFNSWFYYQPGLLYAEHGHRFDEYCTTPPQLAPLRPQDEEELTLPLSALAIRYFANTERGFTTHDKEHWGIRDYLSFFQRKGWGHLLGIIRRYIGMIGKAVSYHLEHGRFVSEQAAREHQRRLGELLETTEMESERLEALESLSAKSVMGDAFGLFTMLGFAEWSGVALVLVVGLLTLLTGWGWVVDLLLVGAAAVLGMAFSRYARGRFPTDIRRKLDEKAEAISKLLEVPVVAMGHCHAPRRRRMAHDHRAFYVNTGSFLTPEGAAHAADADCRCRTTFVRLPAPVTYERPNPELLRWCTVNARPEPFR